MRGGIAKRRTHTGKGRMGAQSDAAPQKAGFRCSGEKMEAQRDGASGDFSALGGIGEGSGRQHGVGLHTRGLGLLSWKR